MENQELKFKQAKELFVSNLNGTSVQEIDEVLILQPLSALLFFLIHHQLNTEGSTFQPHISSLKYFVLNMLCLIGCPLLALTICADHLGTLHQVLLAVSLVMIILNNYNRAHKVRVAALWNSSVSFDRNKQYIAWYRSMVNILTAVCILAVDFHIYPRRFAKTETYGTGLLDISVGSFIICNSIVCKEATDAGSANRTVRERLESVMKVVKSSLPLTALGITRLITTRVSNYQEHVTEYGAHWNFFMTLAVTRIACTLIMCLVPPKTSLVLSVSIAGVYQCVLNQGLGDYILGPADRGSGFLAANREGIFSTIGYMSLYFGGVAIGQFIFKRERTHFSSNVTCALVVLAGSFLTLAGHHLAEEYIQKTSRRLANLSFILWSVHHSLLTLGLFQMVYLILHALDFTRQQKSSILSSGLVEAVNFNGLLYFLLANVLTGAINLLMDTLSADTFTSLAVLSSYLIVVNLAAYILYVAKVKTKFW